MKAIKNINRIHILRKKLDERGDNPHIDKVITVV